MSTDYPSEKKTFSVALLFTDVTFSRKLEFQLFLFLRAVEGATGYS